MINEKLKEYFLDGKPKIVYSIRDTFGINSFVVESIKYDALYDNTYVFVANEKVSVDYFLENYRFKGGGLVKEKIVAHRALDRAECHRFIGATVYNIGSKAQWRIEAVDVEGVRLRHTVSETIHDSTFDELHRNFRFTDQRICGVYLDYKAEKPKGLYVIHDEQSAKVLIGKSIYNKNRYNVKRVTVDGVIVTWANSHGPAPLTFQILFNSYVMEDGSPCGQKLVPLDQEKAQALFFSSTHIVDERDDSAWQITNVQKDQAFIMPRGKYVGKGKWVLYTDLARYYCHDDGVGGRCCVDSLTSESSETFEPVPPSDHKPVPPSDHKPVPPSEDVTKEGKTVANEPSYEIGVFVDGEAFISMDDLIESVKNVRMAIADQVIGICNIKSIDDAREYFNGNQKKLIYKYTDKTHIVTGVDRKGNMILLRENGESWVCPINRLYCFREVK